MHTATVAAVCDNTIDLYRDGRVFVGGNALNVAVQLRRLGVSTTYFGAIGRDDDGSRIAAVLRERGVSISGLVVVDGPTAVTEISITTGGDRVFDREDFGVTATYDPSRADVAQMAAHDWVHIGMVPRASDLVGQLRALNPRVLISQDCAVSSGFARLDVAFCSTGEDPAAARRAAAVALTEGAALVVVTQGAAGATAWTRDQRWHCNAVPTEVVDTTGAGDSFIAAFIAARAAGAEVADALRAGARLAAETCTHQGGFAQ